ncbi:hypothetical protein GGF44_001491, partial [Coemansia sp. RSA 1694]
MPSIASETANTTGNSSISSAGGAPPPPAAAANSASPSTAAGPTSATTAYAPSLFPSPPLPPPHPHSHRQQPHEYLSQEQEHYRQQHYSPPQHYSYAYSPTLASGSPTSALGFISASPPAPLAPLSVNGPSTGGGGGFSVIGAQIIGGPSVVGSHHHHHHHGPAFAYYPGSSSLSGSPPQSLLTQQLPPLVSAGALPGLRDYESALISSRHQQQQQQQQQLVGSPPPSSMVQFAATTGDIGNCSAEAVDSRNVYIRNLPEECTDTVLARMASPYGGIESSKSIIDEITGKCKGYGFVKYRTADQAEKAIEAFNAQGLHSTLARDSFKSKLKRLQDKSSANVYVSNLSSDIDEAALVDLIRPHPVISARILRDTHTGQHKGAGFA